MNLLETSGPLSFKEGWGEAVYIPGKLSKERNLCGNHFGGHLLNIPFSILLSCSATLLARTCLPTGTTVPSNWHKRATSMAKNDLSNASGRRTYFTMVTVPALTTFSFITVPSAIYPKATQPYTL